MENTKLNNNWVFWFHDPTDNNWDITSYKKIYEMETIHDFWSLYNRIDSNIVENSMKVCKICNIEKEINQFPKNKKMKDGLLNSCKTCLNKRRKISYKKNIDKRKEYLSKNKEKIKERFKKYHKSYYNDNREKILDYQKIYRLKNIDMKKEYEKKYRSENKDKRSKYHKERIKNIK